MVGLHEAKPTAGDAPVVCPSMSVSTSQAWMEQEQASMKAWGFSMR